MKTQTQPTETQPKRKPGRRPMSASLKGLANQVKRVTQEADRYQSIMDAWNSGSSEQSWIKTIKLLRRFQGDNQ